MTSLLDRVLHYHKNRGIPDTAGSNEMGEPRRLLGTAIVFLTGLVVVVPLTLGVVRLLEGSSTILTWGVVLLTPVAGFLAGMYIGGPVADHILGISREGLE